MKNIGFKMMMNMPKLQPHFWVLILITLFMGLYRVIGTSTSWTFYTQFTPLGAMALFGGAYFRSQPHALLMPLLTLFVSDIIIMQTVFPNYQSGLLYAGWYWTYLSFMGMTVIGRYFLYKRVGIFRFIGGAFSCAVFHWVVSDIGICFMGGDMNIYAGLQGWTSIAACYIAAIPFMKPVLMGNLLYGAIFFATYEGVVRLFSSWHRMAKEEGS